MRATVEGVADGGVVRQLIKSGSTTYKALIAGSEDVVAITDDDDDYANYYQAAALDFTGFSDSVQVDLNDNTHSAIDGGDTSRALQP